MAWTIWNPKGFWSKQIQLVDCNVQPKLPRKRIKLTWNKKGDLQNAYTHWDVNKNTQHKNKTVVYWKSAGCTIICQPTITELETLSLAYRRIYILLKNFVVPVVWTCVNASEEATRITNNNIKTENESKKKIHNINTKRALPMWNPRAYSQNIYSHTKTHKATAKFSTELCVWIVFFFHAVHSFIFVFVPVQIFIVVGVIVDHLLLHGRWNERGLD